MVKQKRKLKMLNKFMIPLIHLLGKILATVLIILLGLNQRAFLRIVDYFNRFVKIATLKVIVSNLDKADKIQIHMG